MSSPRRFATIAALATSLTLAVGLAPLATAGAATSGTSPQLPQLPVARQAAGWLAGQFNAQGFIPTSTPGSTSPDLSTTAQSVLALAAADVDLPVARQGLTYLQAHVATFVTVDGAPGPGKLALLILDAEALGANPHSFGGTDLVARLLATQQTSGTNAGLFGTETQLATEYTGTYDQGLVLTALAAVGVHGTAQVNAAVSWLAAEQCAGGGWTFPDQALNTCTGTPDTFPNTGPDTNSTALAVEGLVAQGALSTAASTGALGFFTAAQDADAGWSYYPNSSAMPQPTQPTSTALVIQALLALGTSPTAPSFAKGTATPISTLLTFQLSSGTDAGAFFQTTAPTTGNVFATYEAIPALAGLTLPFGPSGTGYWEVASDGGIFSFGTAQFYGSMGGKSLNAPIVGMTATPTGKGYWEVASDGGIFSFGAAQFYGSMGGKPLNKPIVGMTATPTGKGYWLVASDGGVFAFGTAAFEGSAASGATAGPALNSPIVGLTATPDGKGYWLIAANGEVLALGDATLYGSMAGTALNSPIVGLTATPDGKGYWLVASDGGIFAFGDALFSGSMGGKTLNKPVVGIASTPDGKGYWEVASDGGIFAFGTAQFYGSMGGKSLNAPIVGIGAGLARPA
jgi:ribosomal protein L24E